MWTELAVAVGIVGWEATTGTVEPQHSGTRDSLLARMLTAHQVVMTPPRANDHSVGSSSSYGSMNSFSVSTATAKLMPVVATDG